MTYLMEQDGKTLILNEELEYRLLHKIFYLYVKVVKLANVKKSSDIKQFFKITPQ